MPRYEDFSEPDLNKLFFKLIIDNTGAISMTCARDMDQASIVNMLKDIAEAISKGELGTTMVETIVVNEDGTGTRVLDDLKFIDPKDLEEINKTLEEIKNDER